MARQLHDLHGTAHLLTMCAMLDLEAIDEESSVSGAAINRRYEGLVDESRYQQSTYKSLDRLVDHALVAKSTGAYTNCYWLTEDGRGSCATSRRCLPIDSAQRGVIDDGR